MSIEKQLENTPYLIEEPFYNNTSRKMEFPPIKLGIDTARKLKNIRLNRKEYIYLRSRARGITEENGIFIKNKINLYSFVKGDATATDINSGLLKHIFLPGDNRSNIILVQSDEKEIFLPNKKYLRYKIYSPKEYDSKLLIELWKFAVDYLIRKKL